MISGPGRSARAIRVVAVAAVLPVTLLFSPSAANASISSPAALAVANSIGATGTDITAANWLAKPANGTPDGISDAPLGGFPTDGKTFAILTTGDVFAADDKPPSTDGGTTTDLDQDGTHTVRGDKDHDVSILKIDFNVGQRMNCISFDFRFLSEEWFLPNLTPEDVSVFGQAFNDAFIAEVDAPDLASGGWKTEGDSAIPAPHNFAFDTHGHPISILSLDALSMSNGPSDTTYDGATPILTASTEVTPGAHSLILSIFDHGDRRYDSAVFVDNLVVGHAADPKVQCKPGAAPKGFDLALAPATATHPVGTSHTVTATVTNLDGGAVAAGKPVVFAASGVNTANGTGTTDAAGHAAFSYTGTAVGTDSISACYDVNVNAACDSGEPFASVEAAWTAASTPSPSPSTTTPVATNELPRTGRPIGAIAGIGGLAVLLGAVAVFLVRRRREHVAGE